DVARAFGQRFYLTRSHIDNPQLRETVIFVNDDRRFGPRLLAAFLGDKCDKAAVGRPLETLNRSFMPGQLNRLAARRVEQEDLRPGVGVGAPLRQKGYAARVRRPSRRIVALALRGQPT